MPTLHIEHAVFDFDAWKRTFDAYADHRQRGGVRAYRISRPVDDSQFAIIDLEFDELPAAQTFLTMLQGLWAKVEGKVIREPRAQIVDIVERKDIEAHPR